MNYKNIKAEKKDMVGVITLNRPDVLNALSSALIGELGEALTNFESDQEIGVIVILGGEKAFAAGADIKEMLEKDYFEASTGDFLGNWGAITKCKKPTIAAVSGYALGGGCELAMQCDIIIATEDAKFGQPEINIGVIPGAGGTQRLTRAIGKYKSMEMILTGRMMNAHDAETAGLVTRVVKKSALIDEAMDVANKISKMPRAAVIAAKSSVNRSFETTLAEGILFEKTSFYSLFATEDQTEGMRAFAEKREPKFRNR
ncbi:MAG: enoyl-CoA hydratase [Rhodospirillaceae bacterium]|nr:enoyl-CoA hydratase [Rhodospirillaceae bacterium]|tara:strand:+ start:6613 stop:7386 length:774 start_codon:yes stop_codon:yes gene_type:complete